MKELEKKKHGIGKGSVAAIGANVMISALTGNLHDTRVLNSIGQRLAGDKSVSDTELKTAQQEMLNAAATLKILENANHIKVQGKHNDIDFDNLEKYKGDKQMEEFMKHQAERIEAAKNGKIDPKELQSDLDKAKNDAGETVESEEGKMIKSGVEGLIGSVKEGIHLGGVVTGKGGQAETDKARDGSANQGSITTGRDSSGPNGHEDKIKTDFDRKRASDDTPPNQITGKNLTLNNEGNKGGINKPDELETTGLGTGGNNVTGVNGSGFFPNNPTGGSNIALGNVQGNAFGYGSGKTSGAEVVNLGTGNITTETVRNKTKETIASNTDKSETPKINTNNITIGKNNNKKE